MTNPLCGPHGATFTFGKQKGLDPSKFQEVDAAIKDFYSKIGPEILKLDGAGAGGGIAAGLCAFAGAEIVLWYPNLFGFDKVRSKSCKC